MTSFFEQYDLGELIGKGGFAKVYSARQRSTGQPVAIKILEGDCESQEWGALAARFEREIQFCAILQHPHIVRLIDQGRAGDQLCAVFELVPGVTLAERLSREGAISPPESLELMLQVLDALHHAHERGVIHRDLKPQNIMIAPGATRSMAKVVDFGIGAFTREAVRSKVNALTRTGDVVGTPQYAAPEQLRGETPTLGTDLYSWGLVFLECLTGQPAVQGKSVADIYHQHLSNQGIAMPSSLAGHPLGALLRAVLQKNTRERASEAGEIWKELKRVSVANLVGSLRPPREHQHPQETGKYAPTIADSSLPWEGRGQRRQVTAVSVALELRATNQAESESEEAIPLLNAQLARCRDTMSRFGGTCIGSLANQFLILFGYPIAEDADLRRASRAVLELSGQVRQRSHLLHQELGLGMDLYVGVHTGLVHLDVDGEVRGYPLNAAMRLQGRAEAGKILVNSTFALLAKPYVEMTPIDRGEAASSQDLFFELRRESSQEAMAFQGTETLRRPLVARAQELLQLREAWRGCLARWNGENTPEHKAGDWVLISGEPGVGKSRLVAELLLQVERDGGVVLETTCLFEDSNSALRPIVELVLRLVGVEEAEGDHALHAGLRRKLAQAGVEDPVALPLLCQWLQWSPPEDSPMVQLAPEAQRNKVHTLLRDIILHAEPAAKLLLFVEDIHWADPTTLQWLRTLADDIGQTRLMLVMTCRPEGEALLFGEENDESTLDKRTLHLAPFSAEESLQFVRQYLGKEMTSETEVKKLVERGDGVPLFLEELANVKLSGTSREGNRFTADTAVPMTLRELLSARLDKLGPAKETAQIAAALGREFGYEVLSAASLLDKHTLQSHLAELVRAKLVVERRDVSEDHYLFRHALIRDAAYEGMPEGMRAEAHARICRAVTQLHPEWQAQRTFWLAQHHAAAKEYAPAIELGTIAARSSLQRSALSETLAITETTLGWLKQGEEPTRSAAELDLYALRIPALMSRYHITHPEVGEGLKRCDQLLDAPGETPHRLQLLWLHVQFHNISGNLVETERLLAKLLPATVKAEDFGLQAASEALSAYVQQMQGRYGKAAMAARRSIQLYDPERDGPRAAQLGLDIREWATCSLAFAQYRGGAPKSALLLIEQANERSKRLKQPMTAANTALVAAGLHSSYGEFSKARAFIADVRQSIAADGPEIFETYASIIVAALDGDAQRALSHLEEVIKLGQMAAIPEWFNRIADSQLRNQEYCAAFDTLSRCLTLGEEHQQKSTLPETLTQRGRAAAMIPERREEAQPSFRRAADLARKGQMFLWEAEALHCLFQLTEPTLTERERLAGLLAEYPELPPFLQHSGMKPSSGFLS